MIRKDIPEPAVPYYVGTARLEEPADTRMRSMGRVDEINGPYPVSEESDDDVIYAEEYESELQQINLRNEAPNQITVDTCGERCAQLDDFNWFLPTDEWNEKSDIPESEIDISDSVNGVHVNASDSSLSQTETMTQRLSGPRWSLRRDLKGAVRQQCPGECAGMSGRRTILQRRIQDRNPSPQVQLILRGYIKCQNVSRRWRLDW